MATKKRPAMNAQEKVAKTVEGLAWKCFEEWAVRQVALQVEWQVWQQVRSRLGNAITAELSRKDE